ncbi:MAG: translation initiation factor IF-1 [Chloroflexota bacterium]
MEVRSIRKRDDKFAVEGVITDAFPGGKFNVRLDNGHELIGYISGKIRRYNIRVLLGDRVKVELSPYDLNRGRIIYRYKRRDVQRAKGFRAGSAPSFAGKEGVE